MRILFMAIFTLFNYLGMAQIFPNQAEKVQFDSSASILVKRIGGDSTYSAFVIHIQNEVKPHYHQYHTEVISVLRGKAKMQMGDTVFTIRKNDVLVIPAGTVHSVRNLRKKPIKVLSIQTPHFDGKDRIWKEL